MKIQGNRALRVALIGWATGVPYWATPAAAQSDQATPAASETDRPVITEVVVTAQRREQSIQDVGISVTAISGETLAQSGVTSALGLAAQVPGLEFDSGSGGGVNAFVSIRGVSQVDPAEHQEAPNAVYLDEVYVPTPSMVGFPVYDVARAEALRGPQGTLFGRNSTGGLLHFVTNDPSEVFQGYFDASYANYNTFRAESALGGPLAEGVNFRLAGFVAQGDGIFKNHNPNGKDSFETDSFGFRGKLAVDFGPGWNAKLTASLNESPKHREGTYKGSVVYVDANGVPQYLPPDVDFYGTGPGNDLFGYRDAYRDKHAGSFNSDVGHLEKTYRYVTLRVAGPVAGTTLTSISNYSRGDLVYSEDSDGSPNEVNNFGNSADTKQITQEIRLSGQGDALTWTTGVYFLDIKGDYDIFLDLPWLSFFSFNVYEQETRSYAAFGQVEYQLADALKLTVGGRYTRDRKTFESRVFDRSTPANNIIYDFSSATVGSLARMSNGDWAGKVQLDYSPTADVLLYAGLSRGIRGGGFNASPDGAVSLTATPFRNETVVDYEGGVKLRLFDGRAQVRTGVFYYDYNDYQAFNFQGTIGSVSNNDGYNYGGELELSINPLAGLDISLGASSLRGKVKDFRAPLGTVFDTEPVKAPHFTFNGLIAKVFDVGDYRLRAQYDFDYQSESNANLFPSPITALPASWMHNARLSASREDIGWELYAFVRNLADEERKTFAYDLSFESVGLASYAPPRTYGVGFRKSF